MKIQWIRCAICDETLNIRESNVWAEVVGWSRFREQGGSNQVSLRKETGRYAHDHCMRMRLRGVDVSSQESML